MLCRSCLRARLLAERSSNILSTTRPRLRHLSVVAAAAAPSATPVAFPSKRPQETRAPQLSRLFPAPLPSRSYSSAPAPSPQSGTIQSSPDRPSLEKPDFLDEAEALIWDRLSTEFAPVELVVQDISGGCGSMYGIEISSERFRGATMLKQQRMVNSVLGDLMKNWHGVQLKTRVP